ncbi:HSP20-like chaperone [Mycena latifolia]|nr:HSP20-like chaperone [Mycena latifolia]
MSPAPILKQSRMSDPDFAQRQTDSAQRQAARRYILGIYEAIRVGRLRVVDPHPAAAFRPRMEVYNDPDSPNIVATFELPGVKISDVSISVRQGMLLIQGDRRPRYRSRAHPSVRGYPQAETADMDVDSSQSSQARVQADARFFPYQELRYGSFRRAIRLPPGADTSCINASLSDGLLTVSWPRSPAGPKQMEPSAIQEPSSLERPTSSVRADPHGTTDPHSHGSE